MNVRTLCLAILFECEASGYEIRKLSTEGEYSYFVEASFGSIYPALAKLEEESLVTSRIETQEGRPAKKVYSITEAGRDVMINSLFHDLDQDVFRSEFLLFARFAPHLPKTLVEERLNQRLIDADAEIAKLEDLRTKISHSADEWVLQYGLNCMLVARDYLRTHMDELIALARPDGAAEAAE